MEKGFAYRAAALTRFVKSGSRISLRGAYGQYGEIWDVRVHISGSSQECSSVMARGLGLWRNSGVATALFVPMLGPVSGTSRMALLKCSQAPNMVSSDPAPNSRRAMARRSSLKGGASLQLYQARISAM